MAVTFFHGLKDIIPSLKASFLCILEAASDYKDLFSPWTIQVPTCSTGLPVCVPRKSKHPRLWCPSNVSESRRKRTQFWTGRVELRESVTLPVHLNAFRLFPTVSLFVGGRKLGKSCDQWVLGSPLSGNNPHGAYRWRLSTSPSRTHLFFIVIFRLWNLLLARKSETTKNCLISLLFNFSVSVSDPLPLHYPFCSCLYPDTVHGPPRLHDE
jgi:hypothetical protein